MKILVIDDQPCNIESARLTLQGHDFMTAASIEEAYEILRSGERFDVVLTDLWLPSGSFRGALARDYYPAPTAQIPAGLVFAISAANNGMKVVICTDSDHHQDILCSVMDLINRATPPKERTIFFVEARTCPVEGCWENGKIVMSEDWYKKDLPHPKNWGTIIERFFI